MKKLVLIILSAIVLIGCFSACAGEAAQQKAGEGDYVPQDPFELAGMPVPFEHSGGDDDADFYNAYTSNFISCPLSIMDAFADYLGMDRMEFVDAYHDKFGRDFWIAISKSDVMETVNPYSIIIGYDIPNEIIAEAIQKHNEIYENFAVQFNDDGYRDYKYTDAELKALLSRDAATVLEHFATDYAIVINDKVYSPVWLYLHTPDDYAKAGITSEMIEEKLTLYSDFALTAEAEGAFEGKLSEYMGHEVAFERRA